MRAKSREKNEDVTRYSLVEYERPHQKLESFLDSCAWMQEPLEKENREKSLNVAAYLLGLWGSSILPGWKAAVARSE